MPVYFPNGAQVISALAFGAAYKKAIALQANGDVLFLDRPDDPDLTVETIQWTAAGGLTFAPALTFSNTLTIALGTITTDKQNLSMTATWNAAGVTFTALKLNVTDTASAAASLLADLQKGGTSQFKVDKNGAVTALGAYTGTVLNLTAATNQLVLASGAASTGTVSMAALSASRTWTFPNVTGTLITSGDTGTVTNTMLAGAIAAAKLVGTDIATVGTITAGVWNGTAIARAFGGTGVTAATTDGQLLIGNTGTGNWSVATLTAGANITITNGAGSITIAATGGPAAATKAEMEAATSTTVYASPGRTQNHPGVVKAWADVAYTAGVPSALISYNISSITDTGVGIADMNLTTAFSTNNSNPMGSANSTTNATVVAAPQSSTQYRVRIFDSAGAAADIDFTSLDIGTQ